MPAKYVRPYSKGQKNDFRDAEAIAEAVQRPTMRFVPTKSVEQLDLQALHRVRERLVWQRTGVTNQIREIETERLARLKAAPAAGTNPMVRLLARVVGISIETADMLVHEVLPRRLRDRRALARYAGLTGSPDESGAKRRERGLARSGNARVRLGMIQLAWRFLWFQKDSALGRWYRERTAAAPGARKTLIVALARKLLVALWRLVHEGVIPEGWRLRPAT